MFGIEFQAWVRRISMRTMRPLARSGLTPNMLTIFGLLLNVVTAVVIGGGYLFAAGMLLLVASGFDMADGALARVSNQMSEFGDFLDATLDRLAEASVGLGLIWHALAVHDDLMAAFSYAFVPGSVMVSYARARAEVLHLDCEVGLMARPERIIVLVAGLILAQTTRDVALTAILGALCVSTYYTVAQRIVHVYRITKGTHGGANS
jgi:CDP-diacylglycerol---glycerol-3-phosphate 3-phosphatidyltransferase